MGAPAVLARVILAALKRWAPKYVGAALKVLGTIELAELARDAYRAIFGGDEPHAQALAGYQADTPPPDLLAFMRSQLGARFDPYELIPVSFKYVDEIPEEEILREMDAAEARTPRADLTVNVLQSRGACRRRK